MTLFFLELLKKFCVCLEIFHCRQRYYYFSIIWHKKKFRIAHKFPDSNATFLPGFFSLWLSSPSTGGLEPISRSRHSYDDVAVAITITVEVHFSLLTGSSEAEESPEQLLELPDPSHPGWGIWALQQWPPTGVEKQHSSQLAARTYCRYIISFFF